jgi:predicted GNAT family N-acyltransferase
MEFMKLVIEADEVDPEGLERRVMRAERLIFLHNKKEVIGVAATKRPGKSRKESVFRKAQSTEDPTSFTFELGWIVVNERFRGQHLSRTLVEAALEVAAGHRIFATTRTDNLRMQKTIERYGFHAVGKPYPTSREGRKYDLTLFIKQFEQVEPAAATNRGDTQRLPDSKSHRRARRVRFVD